MAAEDLISDVKTKLEPLLAPINGGVGTDVSYDDQFEFLKNEVDKLTSLSGGKVEWGGMVSAGEEILTDKSKDFRVALYYSAAKINTDGFPGLLDGLVLLDQLIANFWGTMFPARPKARGNLCTWFADHAAVVFNTYQPTANDRDLVKAVETTMRAVDGELRDKLADNYGGMSSLQSLMRSVVASLPKEAPPAPPPQAKPAAAPAASSSQSSQEVAAFAAAPAPSGTSPASITDASSASSAITECALLLSRAGDALRVADPGDPLAYRIARTGFWLEVNQAPPAEEGRTLVPPPPDGMRSNFDSLGAADNWMGVIHAADEAAAEYILWLDPHRYAANAMDRLGAIFINAKKTLLREVAVLLLRVPTLPNLMFSDGTPLADGQTKMWLESEVQALLGSGGGGGGGGGGGVASFLDEPIREARTLAASGKLQEAIELVGKAASAAPSGGDRFRGRLAIAQLCLQSEQFAIARAQLEGLLSVVEQHRLNEWEPALCAELYSALYAAHRGMNRGDEIPPEARAREAAAFEKLCQLDAGAALKLSVG